MVRYKAAAKLKHKRARQAAKAAKAVEMGKAPKIEERQAKREKYKVAAKTAAVEAYINNKPPVEVSFGHDPGAEGDPSALPAHDLRITSSKPNVTFLAHREVLSARSTYFRNVLRESPATLDLPEEHGVMVLVLLKFCYSDEYDAPTAEEVVAYTTGKFANMFMQGSLTTHAYVASAADKYALPALRDLAIEAFVTEVTGKLERASSRKALAQSLVYVAVSKATRWTPLPAELYNFIIDAWTKDDCNLARCYTDDDRLYKILLVYPELRAALTEFDKDGEERCQTMRDHSNFGSKKQRRELCGPLGLHTPV